MFILDFLQSIVESVNSILWDYLLIILLCGTGIYFSFRLKFVQIRKFKAGIKSPVITTCTNFYIEEGNMSKSELLKTVENGIIINDVAGLHAGANIISGDFSLSAEGFLIENGEITKPVEQITVAGNFYDILKKMIFV